MEIRYRLSWLEDEVIVSLDVKDPNEIAPIKYEGEAYLIKSVRLWLEKEDGAFGHIIGDRTCAIDLDAAMHSDAMQQFEPELIEGGELVKSYDPGIPDGAVT